MFSQILGFPKKFYNSPPKTSFSPPQPKGYVGKRLGDPGLKPTVRVGEAMLRECAAYLLDHNHFSSVPRTALCLVSPSLSYLL